MYWTECINKKIDTVWDKFLKKILDGIHVQRNWLRDN
jgi:hypothetical protein